MLAGRYRKLGTIGAGGMARVLLAEDERLGRRVAIKRLHADSPLDAARRFEREARTGASLNHPNLVSVYDVDSDGDSVLIVMEYVEGETLKEALASGPLDTRSALSIAQDVAAALDHAHAHGVVHRDVKPANILIRGDGVAKLADLGIATAAESTRITRSGIVLGTASYMAPEQLEGEELGPAVDVYSLAAVTYEALSGRKAREGSTPAEIAAKAVNEPPPDLREAWPDAPAGAALALHQGMALRPAERPASAGELVAELERALGDVRPPVVEPVVDRTLSMAASPVRPAAPTRPAPPPRPAQPPPAPPSPRPAPQRSHDVQRGSGLPRWLPGVAGIALLLALAAIAFTSLSGGDGEGSGTGSSEPRAASREERSRPGRAPARHKATPPPAPAPAPVEEEPDQPEPSPAPAERAADGDEAAPTDDPAELNRQGFSLMSAGRYDEAIPLLEQAVASYGSDGSSEATYAYALYNLGRSLRLAGRADEAVPILERRLEIPNQTATVRRELEAARRAAG